MLLDVLELLLDDALLELELLLDEELLEVELLLDEELLELELLLLVAPLFVCPPQAVSRARMMTPRHCIPRDWR